jgi:hypothetical protein
MRLHKKREARAGPTVMLAARLLGQTKPSLALCDSGDVTGTGGRWDTSAVLYRNPDRRKTKFLKAGVGSIWISLRKQKLLRLRAVRSPQDIEETRTSLSI